jgi:hypothetical protein
MTWKTTNRTTTEGTMNRGRAILAAGALLLAAAAATAQLPEPPSLVPMQRLDFLVGTWEGEGWMEYEPGRRATFTSKEIVEPRLGGRVLVVEGLHYAPMPGKPEPVLVHHAMGVFSHHEGDGYRFHTWLANGHGGEHTARLDEEGAVIWGYDDPRRGEVRYTITLSESGEWVEVGDSSQDGETWTRFFEMKLAKR